MKLIIEIPDEIYARIVKAPRCVTDLDAFKDRDMFVKALQKGQPLPETHGRLIDADNFRRNIDYCHPFTKYVQDTNPTLNAAKSDLLKCLYEEPTVIKSTTPSVLDDTFYRDIALGVFGNSGVDIKEQLGLHTEEGPV